MSVRSEEKQLLPESAWAGERLDEARWPDNEGGKHGEPWFRQSDQLCSLDIFEEIAFENARKGLAVATLLVMVLNSGWAQEIDSSVLQAEAAAQSAGQRNGNISASRSYANFFFADFCSSSPCRPSQSQTQAATPFFMLPPGTKLPLGLLRPLELKPGRDVYLQITFPVTVGNQMVIPPGTYIQGWLSKLSAKTAGHWQFEIRLANMIFLNGYTVPISGTVKVATTNAACWLRRLGPQWQAGPAMAAVGESGASTATAVADPFPRMYTMP